MRAGLGGQRAGRGCMEGLQNAFGGKAESQIPPPSFVLGVVEDMDSVQY